MDFRTADFPSDCLSVKRFRAMFPDHFDGEGLIVDGYCESDFFFPLGREHPEHLVRLSEMIAAERTIASGAFLKEFLSSDPTLIGKEELETLKRKTIVLEERYLFFKLADSPATARLLINQVEDEGRKQAVTQKNRQR